MASIAGSLRSYERNFPATWTLPFADFRSPRHYRLVCPMCGTTSEDNGYQLACASCQTPALLRAVYADAEPVSDPREPGIFRYRNWLPVRRSLPGAKSTVVYQSERLSRLTGLKRLWVAFNGYWPDRGANLLTGSFKELEAYCVLGRLPAENRNVLVIASAGNTAAGFARAASQTGTPCLIVVPEIALDSLRTAGPVASCVKVVAVKGGDYTDAIRLGESVARTLGFFAEGGARNVARRAGLGTVLLSVFEKLLQMPDYYFQAIGSGTGAIAVHETARQLTEGRGPFPRLWLSQNSPFAPIYDAWKAQTRQLTPMPEAVAKHQIGQIGAKVLANRFPPYAVCGGLYDALVESGGTVLAVSNAQAAFAVELFEASEGIDLAPAAAVAFASLLQAIEEKRIPSTASVVLNVTGGGQRRRLLDCKGIQPTANLSIAAEEIGSSGSIKKITALFEKTNGRSLPCISIECNTIRRLD